MGRDCSGGARRRTVMSSPELTFDEVVEARRPAYCTTMADPDGPAGHEVYREWRYELGQVWLIHRDEKHTYSMRIAAPQEIPWSGWRHDERCDCPFCSGDRQGSESLTGPDDSQSTGRRPG
jgi:hypothetical protein